ncbi:YGR035C and YLR346C [Zygosaccharomyces parabailii]|uniref:BN860_07140g1_1 n=1 Tax=Zygosaccharomyces bailii (strain CLIB 213 / ATCC 58445 / CBS 680 / BCRC 21525 / NBRC 1098 / NCYC 1416 / NRRL Y-2227) TaxID=1333698 RepID=A0A8J2T5B9_ZYGB2|nr:YGR035C and YLR346C [Zygosaccharomyces parabailii]CDF88312.1 BN860_07140g1_1 [Zygosaccharomyces bailii CLIB 213]SJM81885.1 uncharacterized protein ZBIST_0177 [Zygosaccharomyces bailii]
MSREKHDHVLPGVNLLSMLVIKLMISPMKLIVYRGRGYHASTKPNVITRNDLLKASQSSVVL